MGKLSVSDAGLCVGMDLLCTLSTLSTHSVFVENGAAPSLFTPCEFLHYWKDPLGIVFIEPQFNLIARISYPVFLCLEHAL
jgi:hypothetical protein